MVQAKDPKDRVRRLVVSVSPEDMQELDALAAHPRFDGNRSKTVRWAVRIATEVLNDEAVSRVVYELPTEALESYTATRAASYSGKSR